MKKLLLLSAVLFGTVAASQAGVHVDLGFGLPFPPVPFLRRVVISQPTPIIVQSAPVYVVPQYCPPPRVVYAPPPVVYVQPRGYYSYPSRGNWGNRGGYSGYRDNRPGWDNHGGHRR